VCDLEGRETYPSFINLRTLQIVDHFAESNEMIGALPEIGAHGATVTSEIGSTPIHGRV
jgi:hypothetical protein